MTDNLPKGSRAPPTGDGGCSRRPLATVTSAAAADQSDLASVRAARVQLLFSQAAVGIAVNLVIGLLLSWLLSVEVATGEVMVWYALVCGAAAIRGLIALAYHRDPQRDAHCGAWLRLFAVGPLASALAWGLGGAWFVAALGAELQMPVLFVLGGMTAGAMTVLAAFGWLFALYATVLLGPTIAWLLLGSGFQVGMGIMGGVFLASLLVSAFNYQRVLVDSLRLAHRNVRLARDLELSHCRLAEAQRLAQLGHWSLDLQSGAMDWSDETYRVLGEDPIQGDASYQTFWDRVHPADRADMHSAYQSSVNDHRPFDRLHRVQLADGSVKYVHQRCTTVYDAGGAPIESLGTIQDISQRKWNEETLQALSASMLNATGQDYFDRVTHEVCAWFGAEYAHIGSVAPGDKIEVLSMQADGRRVRGVEYPLGDAPCDQVLRHGAQLYPDGVRELFPKDRNLARMNARGYAGFPVTGKQGETLGILSVVSRRPLAMPAQWTNVFGIIAAKAGAEIERLRAEQELRKRTAYLDGILASSVNIAIVAADLDLLITYSNPAAARLLGRDKLSVIGCSLQDCLLADCPELHDLDQVLKKVEVDDERRLTVERQVAAETHYIDVRISGIRDPRGVLMGLVLIAEDTTQSRRDAELIERQANFDALTELPNRRLLMAQLRQALASCRRHGHLGAVLFIDLDNFKHVNDSLGHSVGDALLQEVSRRLNDGLREDDTTSRLGGDEFVILLCNVGDDQQAAGRNVQVVAEKVRRVISQPYRLDEYTLHVTPSIGIALFPSGDETADDILRHADTAMYRAKEGGRNSARFFVPSMQAAAQHRLQMQNDLRKAIDQEQFELHFQPLVDDKGAVLGAETLIRWQHGVQGLVPPGEFIKVAEESGQILAIGDWVLRRALGQWQEWQRRAAGTYSCSLAVNVSPLQFRQPHFADLVERALDQSGVDPRMLTLELTEGVLVENLDSTIPKMQQLKRRGVRFSIDDFGTGYSSLSYLRHLPVTELKIDRSFVHKVTEDRGNATLVETILALAWQLDLEVVAEGVETEAEFAFLRDRGCRMFQGYLFSRPLVAEHFLSHISDRAAVDAAGPTG